MTIIDFYKELSRILERTRERLLSREEAEEKLNNLLQKAEEYDLHIKISQNILDESTLIKLDDERSFTEPDYGDDSYSDSSDYITSY
jgi:hypothetical protein